MTAAHEQVPTIEAGTFLTPNVRLTAPLARGGMGTVWLADHLALETQVAVKVVDAAIGKAYPETFERLRREAALSARIRSVHMVQIFDCGVVGDQPYLVMELLEGASLDEWLALHGRLGIHDCSQIVAQLAKVLSRAHALGIVHRDLKPENVFLMDSDYELFVKLLDFGIAKEVLKKGEGGGVTVTGIAVGTPGYISPEQALNAKRVDHRADLWSLAALAYRMLTGTVPFGDGANGEPWWLRLRTKTYARASEVVPELPAAIDAWFDRALDPDPEKRFQSAAELASEFLAIAADERPSLCGLTTGWMDEPAPASIQPGQFDLFDLADEDGLVSRTVTVDEEGGERQPTPAPASGMAPIQPAPTVAPEPGPSHALVRSQLAVAAMALLIAAAAFVGVLLLVR
jgi:serine/threonine-protein kinase